MSDTAVIHEGFMNGSRMILPRVGVGVGVRVEMVVTHAYNLTVGGTSRSQCMAATAAEFGGGQ